MDRGSEVLTKAINNRANPLKLDSLLSVNDSVEGECKRFKIFIVLV